MPLGIDPANLIAPNYQVATTMHAKVVKQELDRLNNSECIKAYATDFLTSRANVILVYDNATHLHRPIDYDTSRILSSGCADPFYWICGNEATSFCADEALSCGRSISNITPEDWSPFSGERISYCLSESVPERCTLQLSPYIAWTVVGFNLLKVIVLGYVVLRIQEVPLLTIGDAIASFLKEPDETTNNLCLMGKANIQWWRLWRRGIPIPPPRPFDGTRKLWRNAVSGDRWFVCLSL